MSAEQAIFFLETLLKTLPGTLGKDERDALTLAIAGLERLQQIRRLYSTHGFGDLLPGEN